MKRTENMFLPSLLVVLFGVAACSAQARLGQRGEPAASGAADSSGSEAALWTQCLAAKTALGCKGALGACERLRVLKEKESPSAKLDKEMDRLWGQLGFCENELGRYAVAEGYFRKWVEVRERVYGGESREVAGGWNEVGKMLLEQGMHNQAAPVIQSALLLRQKLLGTEHPDVAQSLNSQAHLLDQQGKYDQAESLYRRELEMRKKLQGAEHLDVAKSLSNLSTALIHQGKYAQAEALSQQALDLSQKQLGSEHLLVAQLKNELAISLQSQGKYAQAEPLYQDALQIQEKLLGPEHPDIAQVLNNLALLLERQHRSSQAEPMFRRGLAMRQHLLGSENPASAIALNNLAISLESQGKYAEAESLYRQALALQQKIFGAEHPAVATGFNNLAIILFRQRKYTEALPFYQKALTIWQSLLGSEHPDIAIGLTNLARTLYQQGYYSEAAPFYQRALEMRQKLLGPEHPDVANSLTNQALLTLAQGNVGTSVGLLQQAARIRESQIRAAVSETRTRTLLDSVRGEEELVYGLLLGTAAESRVPELALTTALLRKGRAAEAGARANRLLHRNLTDPVVRQRFETWQTIRQQREGLLYRGPGTLSLEAYQASLKELLIQAESLEADLSAALPEIRTLQPPAFERVVAETATRLPRNAVLVEVVWTRAYHPPKGGEPQRGEPHYVALLLSNKRRISSVDLGPAEQVDVLSRELLTVLRNPASNPRAAAKSLYQLILRPLLPHLTGKKEFFLSMDGVLNAVPFAALHDGTDYLLGRYRFHYLTSGRDLLTAPASVPVHAPLLLASPDFGLHEPVTKAGDKGTLYQSLDLAPLPGTKREADVLGPLLGVTPLVGAQATEQALRAVRSPLVVHVATHALFQPDVQPPDASGSSRSPAAQQAADRSKNVAAPDPQPLPMPGENGAMNRSALLLAGVQQGHHASSTSADGLLTAEEARSLNLEGTQLVTLSACETGQGALSIGQGVYGLRRAFLVAGAETLVTSLWRVNDEATGELMELYYRRLLDEKKPGDRLDAMTEAMKELRGRKDGARAHPYYWAPFLVIGKDGPLRRSAALTTSSQGGSSRPSLWK